MDVLKEVENALSSAESPETALRSVCTLLREGVEHYDWVGFYMVEGDELVLGPYSGAPTEHVRIGFGEGICGQAAETGNVFVVQDVSKESNYLSCSPDVRSEIVLPIYDDGEIIGELDIDSHRISPFGDEDRKMLEKVCSMVAKTVRRCGNGKKHI